MQKSLKEMQEKLSQEADIMKEETQKSIKEIHENTNKQVKELSKTIQDLKIEVETTKKSQRETTLETKKPWKEIRGHRCKYQQQNTRKEERISDFKDIIETMDSTVKENAKLKKIKKK